MSIPAEPVKEDLLDFSPSIEGELWWLDNQTLEFRPKVLKLERGKVYEGELKLDRFIPMCHLNCVVSGSAFVAMKQHVKLNINEIKAYRNDESVDLCISAEHLATMDVCDEAAFTKTIQCRTEDGKGTDLW
jgi:hypothetical protein